MRSLTNTGRWAVPTALATALVATLFISPAIGGPSFVSGKRVVKTITKKTNATQLVVAETKLVGAGPPTTLASIELRPGNYVVSSTFTATRMAAVEFRCSLAISGVADDAMRSSEDGGGTITEDSAAMEVAARAKFPTQAVLICSSPVAASVGDIEITVLKVPKLTVTQG